MKHKSRHGVPAHELMDGPRHLASKNIRHDEDIRGTGRLNARTWTLKALSDWETNTPTDDDNDDLFEANDQDDTMSFDIALTVDDDQEEPLR